MAEITEGAKNLTLISTKTARAIKETKKAADQIANSVRYLQKAVDLFKPFKPTTKSVEINYRTRHAILNMIIETPESMRKINRRISIPKHTNFSVGKVMSSQSFNIIDNAWQETEKEWILPIKNIVGERFLIELTGEIDRRSLDKLVKAYASANRDYTDDLDKYILKAYICNIEFFEKSFKSLTIQDIPFQVKVELSKTVIQTIPPHLQQRITAYDEFKKAVNLKDRHQMQKAMRKSMIAEKEGWSIETANNFIQRVRDLDFYQSFIDVTGQFEFTRLETGTVQTGYFIPQTLNVDTKTHLDLKQPNSNGELIFKRKALQDSLNSEFNKDFKKKQKKKRTRKK